MTLRRKKQADCAQLLRNASCVGSDISWSVSKYLFKSLQLCIDRQNAEGGTDSALSVYGYCVATPIGYFYKMVQVKIMHDKPACVQT